MAEHIKREAAIRVICDCCAVCADIECCDYAKGLYGGCKEIEGLRAIPAADVKPVVRGGWIKRDNSIFAECPNCGCEVMQIKTSVFRDGKGHIDFCPNCGATMKED